MPLKPSFLLSAFLSAASLGAMTMTALPASAYDVTLNGRRAGNPVGDLYNVTLDSASDVGRTLDPVKWYVPAGTSNGSETTPISLSALLSITVKSFTETALTLGINIANTTQVPTSDYRASIMSLGFGVSPDATGVSVNGSNVFDTARVQKGQQNFVGGFKQIDVCIFAAGCSGGDVKEGLQAGQSTSFDLTILSKGFYNSAQGTNVVTLSDFPIKFQTANGSYEPAGVPEPMTIVGSAMALGFGAMYKRRMAKARK
jgi:hypothetical protein